MIKYCKGCGEQIHPKRVETILMQLLRMKLCLICLMDFMKLI